MSFNFSFWQLSRPKNRGPMEPEPLKKATHRHELVAYLEHPWQIVGANYEAPGVLMVEGVHAGSHGAILWAAHILRENAHKWEGAPLTLGHPQVDGQNVSINHPQAPAPIGKVTRARYDPLKKGIVAVLQIPRNTPNVAEIMQLKEVSVGVFSEETEVYGRWNGEEYEKCSISMDADHCAILPPGVPGACSFADGCGVRANSHTNQHKEGDTPMKNCGKILLPPGVYAETADDLQVLRAWDNSNLLPPPEIAAMRRSVERNQAQPGQGYGQAGRASTGPGAVLLPPGVGK